jgi:hypothetical protein
MMDQIENVLDQNANFIHNNEVKDLVDVILTRCNIDNEQHANIKEEAMKQLTENKDFKMSTIKHIKPRMGDGKKPKSAPNKYILFISDPKSRKQAITNLGGGDDISQTDITKELSNMWKTINENKDEKKHPAYKAYRKYEKEHMKKKAEFEQSGGYVANWTEQMNKQMVETANLISKDELASFVNLAINQYCEFEDTELQNEIQSSVANIIQNVIDDKLAIIKKMKSKCTKYVNKKLQPDIPKKPVNTYILFSTHGPYKTKAAELVRKENKIAKKETVPHKLVMKKLGEMWSEIKKNAEDESHEDYKIYKEYVDMHQKNVNEYNEKMAEYNNDASE